MNKAEVQSLASGSPKGAYATVSALQNAQTIPKKLILLQIKPHSEVLHSCDFLFIFGRPWNIDVHDLGDRSVKPHASTSESIAMSYRIFISPKEIPYSTLMNKFLGEDIVESMILIDFKKPETSNHLYHLIEDQEKIKENIEQPAEMNLTELDDSPLELYSVSLFTEKSMSV